MNQSDTYEFIGKYREQLDKYNITFSRNTLHLWELKRIVLLCFANEITEKDLSRFAWALVFEGKYTYEERYSQLISDLLFDIDSLAEFKDQRCKQVLVRSIKEKLNIKMSEL